MRKAARNQRLPQEELDYLGTLTGVHLKARCYELYQLGWPATAIADGPTVSAPTIRNWVAAGPHRPTTPAPSGPDIPTPIYRDYVHKRPVNPGILAIDKASIQILAPKAKKFRARLASTHPSRLANDQLTRICVRLHKSGVPLQEIASVANVSYRAMYRRVSNASTKV